MSRTTTTALTTILASALVAFGIGDPGSNGAGSVAHPPETRPVTTTAPAEAARTPQVSITAGSDGDRDLAEWAVSRFEEARLELPPLVIEFVGPSLAPCGGAQATARLAFEPTVVSVCWGSKLVLLHELAHIWEAGSVSHDQQRRFMEGRPGISSWADPDDSWAEQGREHAANVIAWALMDDAVVIGRTYPNDRASLEMGFAILTGQRPLHDEGGEPMIIDRSESERAAAQLAAEARGGIRSGR